MTTADRRKVLDLLAEGKISADEAERLLKALDRQRPDGPDIASMVDEGVNMVTNAVERLSVDIDDVFEGSSFEHDSRKFTVQSEPRIEVTNFSGRVEIRGGGAEGEVQVDADVPHPDRVRYSVRQGGDTIRVEARPAGRRSLFGWLPFNKGAHISLSIPSRAELDVNNSNGRVSVRNIAGSGSIRTSNGRIVAEELSGDFNLTTSNSRIEARNTSGKYEMTTSNGRVIAVGATGEYKIETSNAQIRFDGEFYNGSENSFTTSNSAITASLGVDPDIRLCAATSNGTIRCLQPLSAIETQSRRRIEAVMGDGKSSLKLRTSNGSITVD